jgi:hypothetical protein
MNVKDAATQYCVDVLNVVYSISGFFVENLGDLDRKVDAHVFFLQVVIVAYFFVLFNTVLCRLSNKRARSSA